MELIPRPTQEQVEEYDRAFGQRLRDLRDKRGLKQTWIAEQMDIHYNSLKNWEPALSHPGTYYLLHLAIIYGVEPEDF